MDSRRQKKFASLIKEAFSEILQRDANHLIPSGVLLTITNVSVTSDLSIAKIYISVFNSKDPEATMVIIRDHNHEFRNALGKKLRHHLRHIPELQLYADDSMDTVFRLENLFKNINKKDEDENESID